MNDAEPLRDLLRHPLRLAVMEHPLFTRMESGPDRALATFTCHQYQLPVGFFPTFLARTIAITRGPAHQTALSAILWQELGEGEPKRAHARLFEDAMKAAGLVVSSALPITSATRKLMASYEASADDPVRSIAFLFATESVDLA